MNSAEEVIKALTAAEQTEAVQKLLPILQEISDHDARYVIYNSILRNRIPKFLYFDEYYQNEGARQRRGTQTASCPKCP